MSRVFKPFRGTSQDIAREYKKRTGLDPEPRAYRTLPPDVTHPDASPENVAKLAAIAARMQRERDFFLTRKGNERAIDAKLVPKEWGGDMRKLRFSVPVKRAPR